MKIQDAIEQGKLFDWKFEHLTPVKLATAAMTMSAALLEIERYGRELDAESALTEILAVLSGETP